MLKLIAVVAAVAGLAAAGAAGASSGKTRVVERFAERYSFSVDCAEFGPYDFENLVSGHQKVQVTDTFDADGELVQTVFHIKFDEVSVNSESGFSLSLKGAVHEVWDYAANTRTLTGAVFKGTSPGGGTFVHDTGRIVLTLDTREVLFVAGPHEAFFAGGVDFPVCAALADG